MGEWFGVVLVELLCEDDIDGAGGFVFGAEIEKLLCGGFVDQGDELFDWGCEGEFFDGCVE